VALLTEAIRWYTAGYMPVPLKPDGTKAPAVDRWRDYQWERPDLKGVLELFKVDSDGIGLICGQASGQLEMFETEGRATDEGYLDKLVDALKAHELDELMDILAGGYVEVTPSGGAHFYYRVAGKARGNTRLASRIRDGEREVLIETRGQGGFTVIAPSGGRSHPTGRSWDVMAGTGPESVPTLTEEQRDALYVIASTLDQMPVPDHPKPQQSNVVSLRGEELRPGDEYNQRATWSEILEPAGWSIYRHYGGNVYGWQRPGKRHPGLSATTGTTEEDRLYVFSTATEFEPEKPFSKFAAYAVLNHGGDYSAAARALRLAGYGAPDPLAASVAPQLGGPSAVPKGEAPLSYIGSAAIAPEPQPEPAETRYGFVPGGTFILDTDPNPVAVWGRGESVLMASGEALIIAAPQGCGKTTLAGQLILGRCGFEEFAELLDYPIRVGQRRSLYLAMDRPKQAARSFSRMVGSSWREELDNKLSVWEGPPPYDLAKHPAILLALCQEADADTVVIDSLKDAAIGLSDDETAAGYNRARQMAITAGVEVIELHHIRKLTTGQKNRSPALDDLYGSTWITSGTGSVILLTGEPGDPVVGFHHVKQPAAQVGPFEVSHDHKAGRSEIWRQVDLVKLARTKLSGLSAVEAAQAMFDTDKVTPSLKEKARRKLEYLTKLGMLEIISEGDRAAGEPTRWGAK
jgi:AAA domain/Bifunctional DNA primase/polymerase, N-terminal